MLVRRATPLLLALLCGLLLPAFASATTYSVDTTLDEPDKVAGGVCETAAGGCSLRAAIEVSNLTVAEEDTVKFNATVFEGQLADTITALTALPKIVSPLEIVGGTCPTAAGVTGPCAGVSGPSGQNVFTVEADGSSIYDLAITGGATGISVINATTGFTARGDWVGLKLDGTNGGNSNTGIFIDPNSNEATIGGTEPLDRNIISFNSVGLDIEGADEAVILGNWFGVKTDGTSAASAAKNIEISDSTAAPGFKAENNEIGATVSQAAYETNACDGGCNVISGATSIGVDLNGNGAGQNEAPASGPTLVHGNFIGLTPAGTGTLANASWGVYAGAADKATIGGFPLGDANYFSGSSEAITSENGDALNVLGNRLGLGPSGSELTLPGTGIFVLASSVTEAANIQSNVVRATGNPIKQTGEVGHITGNEVKGGTVGIWLPIGAGGGLVASNAIEGTSESGILVESPNNEIRANEVIGAGGAGITVQPSLGVTPLTGNLVGGSTTEKENVIEGSKGPAIKIFEQAGEPGSWTEIARNRGSGNSGLFIDLVNGANEGILPPAFTAAIQSKAEGTSLPEAKIRVFRKATAESGEVESFLAETVADPSGKWSVTYPQVPTGTRIAATQTKLNGGTSELATTTAAEDPSNGGNGGNGGGSNGGGGNNGGGNPPPPLDTKIVKSPAKKTHKTTVRFWFKANQQGATFQCKFDRKPFKACRTPKTYKKLKPGKHVFKVRAVNGGKVDPTPAVRKFTVLP